MKPKLAILILLNWTILCNSASLKTGVGEPLLFAISHILDSEKLWSDGEVCKSWMFVSTHDSQEEQLANPIIRDGVDVGTKSILIHIPTTTNLSNDSSLSEFYFDKMYTSEEILQSHVAIGPIKYSRSCSVLFVSSPNQSDYSQSAELTKSIVLHGLARPHKDYFFFAMEAFAAQNFISSQFGDEIRYKYFISKAAGSDNFYSIVDKCSSGDNSKATLFSNECDTILNGKHLVVASVSGTPWLKFQNNRFDPIDYGTGIYSKLFQDSAKLFNFTFTFKFANTGGSSGFFRNGSWFGNVGEVYHRTAHIGLGSGITSQRDTAIDMGIPFEDISRVFFVRAPSYKLSWTAIFSSFDIYVWLLIVLTTGLLIPVYFYSLVLEYAKLTHSQPSTHCTSRVLYGVVTSVVSILVEQEAGERIWIGIRIKFTLLLWMFFSLVIGAGYRSRLIYFLTFKSPGEIPRTHADLIENNYKLFFRYYGGVAYKSAMESPDPMQNEIVRRAFLVNSSAECIVGAILDEKSACLDWDEHGGYASYSNATYHVRQTKDLIIKSKDSLMDGLWIAWIYRNMSPLIPTFDSYLLTTFASGIYNKWVTEDLMRTKLIGATWLNANPNLPANREILNTSEVLASTVKALTLNSLYGVFGVLVLSSLFALAVFTTENVVKMLYLK